MNISDENVGHYIYGTGMCFLKNSEIFGLNYIEVLLKFTSGLGS